MRVLTVAALLGAMLVVGAPPALADNPEREPGPKSAGKVYQWKSKGGLLYEYFVPGGYDPERGANLTFVFHGTGLDRRWTFLNHRAGEFRADDIVVSPDGPAPDRGARLYAYSKDALDAIRALQDELESTFKVRQVLVYGHSQGAFFSILYAAHHADAVDGVLCHSGGVLNGIRYAPEMRKQAVAFMHGTADPLVPFGNSEGGLDWYAGQKHDLVHLRALEGWAHAPEQWQAGQQLAWIEGMTTEDPERLAVSYGHFEDWRNKEVLDIAAMYQVARRLAEFEAAPESARKRAAEGARAIEELAAKHAAAIRAGGGKDGSGKFDGKPWIGHALRFLRDFRGVPARDELASDWEKALAKHREGALERMRDYWRTRNADPRKAFASGVLALRAGFLSNLAADPTFLGAMEAWAKDARKHKLDGDAVKLWNQIGPAYREALQKGSREFDALNRKL